MRCLKLKKLYELRNAVLMSVLVGSYVISGGTAAFAEELKSFNLDEMIVTATATPVESVMKTNAAVNVITREEIQDKHYANLQEVLESIPGYGGFMAANGVGFEVSNYTRPYMRGSDKTVVLIDGVKQNFGGRFYSANAIRNVNDIERIEVLKGTASTLYGAEAVGGVINIITRKHYDKNQGTISASVGNFHTASGQLDYVGENDKTYYALSVMQRHQGDYKDGSGRLRPQDADVTELDLKYGFHIDDKNDLTFKYVNHDQDQTYVEGRGKGNDCPGVGTFRYNTFTAIWDTKGDTNKWANSLSFYRGSMLNDRSLDSYTTGEMYWSEKSRSKTWSVEDRYYNQLTDNNRLSMGFSYFDESFEGLPSPKGSNLQGEYSLKEKSAYVQDEWNILPKLKFTAGVRYADPNIAKSRVLPSFDLGYSFDDNAMVYVSSKDYMNYPTFSWMHGYRTGTKIYKASPDLKPQTGTTNEIGAKFKLSDKTYFDLAYYDRRQKDSISAVKIGNDGANDVYMYQNINEPLHIKGVEANLVQQLGERLTATIGYNHLSADKETLISNMAKDTVSIDLKYRQKDYNVGISGIGRYDIQRTSAFITGDYKLPCPQFWVWNIYGNYQVNKTTKVWAKVNNVFDKLYMYTPEWDKANGEVRYYSKMGRNFMVGVEYSF